MCLDTVTKQSVILQHDMVVYKFITKDNKPIFNTDDNIRFNRYVVEANTSKVLLSGDGTPYQSGFHCYKKESKFFDPPIWVMNMVVGEQNIHVRKFIIPAGEEVTMGFEGGLPVVVTPILVDESISVNWTQNIMLFFRRVLESVRRFLHIS